MSCNTFDDNKNISPVSFDLGTVKFETNFEISAKAESDDSSGPGYRRFTYDIESQHGIMFPAPTSAGYTEIAFKNNTDYTLDLKIYYLESILPINSSYNNVSNTLKIGSLSIPSNSTGNFDPKDSGFAILFVCW